MTLKHLDMMVRCVDPRTGYALPKMRLTKCWVDARGRACFVTEQGDYALYTDQMFLSRGHTLEEVKRYGWWPNDS